MQSAEDRRRLLKNYADEPSSPLAAVLRCAVGIAVLFVVAAGPWLVLSADGRGTTADAAQKAAAASPNAMNESRRAFEERERVERDQEGTKAALAQ